MQNKLG